MLQLINYFLKQGYKITFASAASKSLYSESLQAIGVQEEDIQLNSSSFDFFIKQLQPDMVLFDRFMTEEHYGWRVAECCPNALRILDTEDLHFLRKARAVAVKKNTTFDMQDVLSLALTKREIASIYRCDLSLVISKSEIELLSSLFRIDASITCYVPFMSTADLAPHSFLPFNQRDHFVSIGNFLHEPNWDATLVLKQSIWPLIRRELPKAQLHIYGAYASDKVQQLHNEKNGFIVKGRAKAVDDLFHISRVLLCPLRFGAGLKTKLLMAMETGLPSVTTTIGAEGMHSDYPWPGAVENDYAAFAEAAVALYSDERLYQKAQTRGEVIIKNLFAADRIEQNLTMRLSEIEQTLTTHRKLNFIGQLIQHQTLQSTKYFSKWIEAKNK
jgi:glycosyltransferase involved in cell wall biosynthesis